MLEPAHLYLTKRIIAGTEVELPVLSVRPDVLATLEGKLIRACAPMMRHTPTGYNVLATRNGSDAHSTHTPLLVGAHYDDVGDDRDGPRFPGATDNAAAVAVLLEISRLLNHQTLPLLRPVHLVAFDAEEVRAQGSKALVHNYKKNGMTPMVINLDGVANLHEAVWVERGSQAKALLQALDQAGQ